MCVWCNLFISWKDGWLDWRLKSCWLRECFLYRRQQFSYFLWVFSLVFYRPSPATEAAALVIPMLVWASSPKGLNSFQRFNTLCGSEFAELLFLVFFVRVFNPVMTILNSKSEIRAKFFSWLKWLGFWSMIYSRHSLIYVWLSIVYTMKHYYYLLLYTVDPSNNPWISYCTSSISFVEPIWNLKILFYLNKFLTSSIWIKLWS